MKIDVTDKREPWRNMKGLRGLRIDKAFKFLSDNDKRKYQCIKSNTLFKCKVRIVKEKKRYRQTGEHNHLGKN